MGRFPEGGAVKNGHDKKVAEAEGKAAAVASDGSDDGFEWVVSTKERVLGRGEKETISEKSDERLIRVGVFKTATAQVVQKKGLTINLGNFESARVDVGYVMPCYVEEIKEVEELVNDMIEDRLQAEVVEVRGQDIRPGYEEKRAK
jgi:hypothetical protein